MAAALNERPFIPLADDGVIGAGGVDAVQRPAAADCFAVARVCSALCLEKVVPAILFEQVRALWRTLVGAVIE